MVSSLKFDIDEARLAVSETIFLEQEGNKIILFPRRMLANINGSSYFLIDSLSEQGRETIIDLGKNHSKMITGRTAIDLPNGMQVEAEYMCAGAHQISCPAALLARDTTTENGYAITYSSEEAYLFIRGIVNLEVELMQPEIFMQHIPEDKLNKSNLTFAELAAQDVGLCQKLLVAYSEPDEFSRFGKLYNQHKSFDASRRR